MRKWIFGAAALAALSVGGAAQAQSAAPTSSASQKTALQLMLQKGVITQQEYDAAVVSEVSISEVKHTVVIEAEKKSELPPVTTKWNASMYGFIEADYIYDSTQSFNEIAGNGNVARGQTYQAINHRMQFSVRNTRLGFRLSAPEWGGVKSSGVLETDFFGNQPLGSPSAAAPIGNGNQAGTGLPTLTETSFYNNPAWRLRHAYIKLESPVLDFLFGQTWDLFGWQGYFHPNSVELQGVPGQIYSRTPQLRISKTLKSDAVTFDIAVAASRPPQRDAYVPDLQGGVKLAINGWKGITTNGGTGTNIVPAAIGFSGTWRRFQVQGPIPVSSPASTVVAGPYKSQVTEGWAWGLDVLLPIIPVSNNNRANGLTFTGSLVYGSGINDLYTGLTNASAAGSRLGAATNDAGLVGEVGFGANGKLNAINWRSFIVGLQYYFPGDGRFWVSGNYSQMYSFNVQNFGGTYFRSNFAEANMFWDATNAIRFGLGYSWFRQNYVNPFNATATNNRVQLSAWYLF